MLFDDGCGIPERTLVTIGDYCTLNVGTAIQGHSQEDGAFKSDRITIGSGCTIGIDSLVHYGTTMGDGVVLGPSAFLMKGEEIPPGEHWGGNPARAMPEVPSAPPACADRPTAPVPPPRTGNPIPVPSIDGRPPAAARALTPALQ
jgi:acetyltransferase-like isoleucine patch superfamily enzyme